MLRRREGSKWWSVYWLSMGASSSDLDVETLKRELHGEVVGGLAGFHCDYCGGSMTAGEPICYEAIRVADMPNMEAMRDPPDGWLLDAARCESCECDALVPATDGYDEVLVMVGVREADPVWSLDASALSVVDYSMDGNGYYPPPARPDQLPGDYGFARWLRKRGLLEHYGLPPELSDSFWAAIDDAPKVPPEIERLR